MIFFSFPFVSYRMWFHCPQSYGKYISHLVRVTRVRKNVSDLNERNLCISKKNITPGFSVSKTWQNIYMIVQRYQS